GTAENREWEEAVKHIGPAALPMLLKWLSTDPMLGSSRYVKIRNALPRSFQSLAVMSWLDKRAMAEEMRAEFRAAAAERALIVLGKEAQPAVPELLRLLQVRQGRFSGYNIFRVVPVLSGLGKHAMPEVLVCFSDPQFTNRAVLVEVIRHMRNVGEA